MDLGGRLTPEPQTGHALSSPFTYIVSTFPHKTRLEGVLDEGYVAVAVVLAVVLAVVTSVLLSALHWQPSDLEGNGSDEYVPVSASRVHLFFVLHG